MAASLQWSADRVTFIFFSAHSKFKELCKNQIEHFLNLMLIVNLSIYQLIKDPKRLSRALSLSTSTHCKSEDSFIKENQEIWKHNYFYGETNQVGIRKLLQRIKQGFYKCLSQRNQVLSGRNSSRQSRIPPSYLSNKAQQAPQALSTWTCSRQARAFLGLGRPDSLTRNSIPMDLSSVVKEMQDYSFTTRSSMEMLNPWRLERP